MTLRSPSLDTRWEVPLLNTLHWIAWKVVSYQEQKPTKLVSRGHLRFTLLENQELETGISLKKWRRFLRTTLESHINVISCLTYLHADLLSLVDATSLKLQASIRYSQDTMRVRRYFILEVGAPRSFVLRERVASARTRTSSIWVWMITWCTWMRVQLAHDLLRKYGNHYWPSGLIKFKVRSQCWVTTHAFQCTWHKDGRAASICEVLDLPKYSAWCQPSPLCLKYRQCSDWRKSRRTEEWRGWRPQRARTRKPNKYSEEIKPPWSIQAVCESTLEQYGMCCSVCKECSSGGSQGSGCRRRTK